MVILTVSLTTYCRMLEQRRGSQSFGDALENVGYISIMKEQLEKEGHFMSLIFSTCRETIKMMEKVVIADDLRHRKECNLAELPAS